jgi:hypothetical protein
MQAAFPGLQSHLIPLIPVNLARSFFVSRDDCSHYCITKGTRQLFSRSSTSSIVGPRTIGLWFPAIAVPSSAFSPLGLSGFTRLSRGEDQLKLDWLPLFLHEMTGPTHHF